MSDINQKFLDGVGGRNLILRSSNFTNTENFLQYTGVRNIHVLDGKVFGEAYASNSRFRVGLVTSTNPKGLEYIDGQEYTYSITYRIDKENPENIMFGGKFFFANGGGETGSFSDFTPKVKKISDDVYRAYGTFKVEGRQDKEGEVLHLYVYPNLEGYDSVIIEIHNVQIEFGNVLTDWSPAPEDINFEKYVKNTRYGINKILAYYYPTVKGSEKDTYLFLNDLNNSIYTTNYKIALCLTLIENGKFNMTRFQELKSEIDHLSKYIYSLETLIRYTLENKIYIKD